MTFACFLLAASAGSAQSINEIRISQPAPLTDYFFEIAATPGFSLDALAYVVIGRNGVSGAQGLVETAVSLTGLSVPSDGYFLAVDNDYALGGSIDLQTGLVFKAVGNKTHLLVTDFTGTVGDDLDTNDDGTLDVTAWTATVDCVAIKDTGGAGDHVYCGTAVGPEVDGQDEFMPGHVYVDGGWQIGRFSGGDETPGFANSSLPVELATFVAHVSASDVVLSWRTLSETAISGFGVEQRRDGVFQEIGFVPGHGTLVDVADYRYAISRPDPGRYAFRLRIDDLDGSHDYSHDIEISVDLPLEYAISAPYPNPFNPSMALDVAVARDQDVEVDVYDLLGRHVTRIFSGNLAANQSRTLRYEAGNIPSGTYVIRVTGETFTATRRAVLLK